MDYFARSVAFRHLTSNIRQNLLTVGVVTISVTLIVYLGALIGGLQKRLIQSVTGAIPHVVIRQPEREPIAAWELPGSQGDDPLYVGSAVRLEQRRRKIEDWPAWIPRLRSFDPGIIGVAPIVEGQGFLTRAAKRKAVRVNGVTPGEFNAIIPLESHLTAGRFFGLNAGEVVLGRKLADEFAVRLGDKVRIVSEEGNAESYTIAGIFETEYTQVDEGSVFIPLRDSQALFALGGAVTSIGLKLAQVYDANAIADRLAQMLPYEVESWMRKNQNLLDAMRTQDQSAALILGFTTIAAGFGIAAILITAVMNRLREIGILKAVGATRRQMLSIFALEGILVAAIGGVAGAAAGAGLSLAAVHWWQAGVVARTGAPFQADLRPALVLGAIGLAIVVGFLAALYPAWRAARVNPVEVIRGA